MYSSELCPLINCKKGNYYGVHAFHLTPSIAFYLILAGSWHICVIWSWHILLLFKILFQIKKKRIYLLYLFQFQNEILVETEKKILPYLPTNKTNYYLIWPYTLCHIFGLILRTTCALQLMTIIIICTLFLWSQIQLYVI